MEKHQYLGFPECGGIDHEQSKETIDVEFRRCFLKVTIVWQVQSAGHK